MLERSELMIWGCLLLISPPYANIISSEIAEHPWVVQVTQVSTP